MPTTTMTFTRLFTCPDCNRSYLKGEVCPVDSCCGIAASRPVVYKDRVQVSIFGSKKAYTYLRGDLELKVGDRVEVSVGTASRGTVIGVVTSLESTYGGSCKVIYSVLPPLPSQEETSNDPPTEPQKQE
jgi:hypothetical protein